MTPNGSAFSGVRPAAEQPLHTTDFRDSTMIIAAQHEHVRCNGLLGGGLLSLVLKEYRDN